MSESGEGSSRIDELCEHFAAMAQAVKDLQQGLIQLEERTRASGTTPAQAPVAQPAPAAATGPSVVMLPPEPRVPTPDKFSGDRSKFRSFCSACRLYFALQPRTFSLEETKVGFVIALLQGEPQAWAHNLLDQGSDDLSTLSLFFAAMARLYDDPQRTVTAEAALTSLRQGRRPVEDYVSEFRRWSTDTDWNDAALRFQFRLGLSEALKDELARVGVPETLEDLIALAIQIDRRLRERRAERASNLSRPTWMLPRIPPPIQRSCGGAPATSENPEPMQIGLMRPSLTPEERRRRLQNELCLYCGGSGHFVRTCPAKARKSSASEQLPTVPATVAQSHLVVPLSFQLPAKTLQVNAIIDSGACSCFMDLSFATHHGIPLRVKARSLAVHLADGTHIKSGRVTQETLPIPVEIQGEHRELLSLDAIASPLFPVILGMPWLLAHNPGIDWRAGRVLFQSDYCRQHCFPKTKTEDPATVLLCTEPEKELRSTIPEEYHDFLDVFSKQGADTLPPHRVYDCPIDLLPGAEIPFGPIFPLSEPELEVLREYVNDNLQKGFIRPSTSPAGAGIFFVEKKDHTLRPCVDYRALNKITIKNRYPLPLVPELLQRLRSAQLFTKLDLRGAYNLVRIREGDEWKTAFRTRFGHFEYLVMPFGLCNAPATFQHLVNDVFRDFLDLFVIVYLDDILIFSASSDLHHTHVRRVLQRLRQHGLFAKAEKCEFGKNSIQFLGLVISTEGLQMDPRKITAVLDWPTPTDKKGVQRFVGFANFYRRFVKNFSAIVSPITQLTKQGQAFRWTAEAQTAFSHLKTRFTTAPILKHPDPVLPYLLEVDASETAVGAVLSQRLGAKAVTHPVAFFSRKLTPPERNYDVGDRELLAIKLALEEWRYLLEGAAHPVLVYTDHKNLEYLRTAKRLRPRQARWALFFTRFSLHITYRPGTKNGKADALSRMFHDPQEVPPPDTILSPGCFLLLQPSFLAQLQQATKELTAPPESTLRLQNGLFWKDAKMYVPPRLRSDLLGLCHDHPMAGHFGGRKTTNLVQRSFWWPELRKDCQLYVSACPVCNRNKSPRTRAWGLLRPLPVPERPWQMISLDFIVELPPSQGYTTIFVVVDRLSKMAHFVPLKGIPSALETAEAFVREIVRLHGVPADVVSDRGVQFTSRFWRSLCSALKIELSMSSAYHPQSNGQTERTNQTLEQYLRCFSSCTQDDWFSLLPLAEFAYNNSCHSTTQQSPFFSNYGYHPRFLPPDVPDTPVPAVQDMLRFFVTNNRVLQAAVAKAQADYKRYFDRRRKGNLDLQPGDRVWLSTTNLKLTCPSRKLGPRFIGPYPIRRQINPVAYELKLPTTLRVHPVFHVSLLKPVVPDAFPRRSTDPPPPVLLDGVEEYEVEAILDCRRRRGQTQYLVKWKGYGIEDNSWEPVSSLHAPALLRAYQQSHPEATARVGIRRLPLGRGHCQAPRRGPRAPSGGRAPAGGSARACPRERARARGSAHAGVHAGNAII